MSVVPHNEEQRLAAVRRYDILDTPPDGAFDRVTRIAARLFDVPISIVSIVDHDRIWFKSRYGVDAEEIGRDPGLCASAVCHYEPWLVEDAAVDPRTLDNPLVVGDLGLRFYLAAPLTTSDGYNLGTLNVIDVKPRSVTQEQIELLQDLAAVVMDELELRLAALQTLETRRQQALELNDDVVQGLTTAQLALAADDVEHARESIVQTLAKARLIVSHLLEGTEGDRPIRPGDLVRPARRS